MSTNKDLELTYSGDIYFEEKTDNGNRLKISFYISQNKPLKIQFSVLNTVNNVDMNKKLKISFDIDKCKYDKTVAIINNTDKLIQCIETRLKTPRGEIATDFGSRLELVKHKQLFNVEIQNKIKAYVIEAISDILPGATVEIEPEIINDSTYKQYANILIYDDEDLITKYSLEV